MLGLACVARILSHSSQTKGTRRHWEVVTFHASSLSPSFLRHRKIHARQF